MGKVYKDKKGSSCKLCKPHKAGWAKKHKRKHRELDKVHNEEIRTT